ncbi:MAG: glycerol-3-phosphate acyltransferase [Chloroflexi bacterium]|nr:glycerol-3-phosphate acyltransferase [Chloroflexota bacterium]
MEALRLLWLFGLSYVLGSVPFGYIITKATKGIDVRQVESGRTGGTNTLRAAGFWAGLATATLDILKGASTVWIARAFFPNWAWVHALAPIFAILGHNYSIVLLEREPNGRIRLHGGAGGAPAAGGALGLWPATFLYILPIGAVIFFFIGYASVTTMSVPLITAGVLAWQAAQGKLPWVYLMYPALAEGLILWALRPNIQRLRNGTERVVGLRAWYLKRKRQAQAPGRSRVDP